MNQKNKEELEKEKISLEIKELRQCWLLKPKYLNIIISIVFVFGSIFWANKSGLLDVKYANLQVEKNLLRFEIIHFKDEKDSIVQVIDHLEDSLKYLHDNLEINENRLLDSYSENKKLRIEKLESVVNCDSIKEYYETLLDSISYLRSKSNAIENVLTTESGIPILTSDGKRIKFD